MSYSITINYKKSGAETPLLPENYIVAAETNPTTINEGETISLTFKVDGTYFAFPSRNGASVTGAKATWKRSGNDAIITISEATSDVVIEVTTSVGIVPQLVNKPFLYQLAAPVDTRLVLTKKEMREINDNYLPDTYFALCKDDGHFYLYNKKTEPNEETGKFTLITDMFTEAFTGIDGGEII